MENNGKAVQMILNGISPYGKLVTIEHVDWCKGEVVTYNYLPLMLMYYGFFWVLPCTPIFGSFIFSRLKVGNMFATLATAFLLFKTSKNLGNATYGRFLFILYILSFGYNMGLDIHYITVFFIALTTYFLAIGKEHLSLLLAGLTALTEPFGAFFSFFVAIYLFRKMKIRDLINWKGMLAVGPSVIILLIFLIWDWQGFYFSVFAFNAAGQSNVGTYFSSSSVANLNFFLNPIVNFFGETYFFVFKSILTLLLGLIFSLRYTQTLPKTLFLITLFISVWAFFVNGGISFLYLQIIIVLALLLTSLLATKSSKNPNK